MKAITINILWIEDNPLLTERDSLGHDGIEKLKANGMEFDIPSMKSLNGNEIHFKLKILQHPEEIKEYLEMCNRVVSSKGITYLMKADGVVPDVVVFDYMLNENFKTTGKRCISYSAAMKHVREMFNPTYSFLTADFKDMFKDYLPFPERSESYIEEDFFKAINYDKSNKISATIKNDIRNTKNDEFGLYAGVSIVRFFKEHITCGLPATFNKKDRSSLQPTAKFFEWLNGYDLEGALQRENKGQKDWSSVLKDGVELLKTRIEYQLAEGKVIVTYSHLNDLCQLKSRILTFETPYGIKSLPLDGLFFYETETRDEIIKKWVLKLCDIFSKKTKVKYDDYIHVKVKSEFLMQSYELDLFDKRIALSKMIVKLLNNEIQPDNPSLLELIKLFAVDQTEIDAFRNGEDARYHFIKNHVRDFRRIEVATDDVKRLLALMTNLRLNLAYQEFCKLNHTTDAENKIGKTLKQEPNYRDLIFVLFPIPDNPLILPYHLPFLRNVFTDDVMKDKMKRAYEAWEKPLKNLKLKEGGKYFAYNLTDAEKLLCLSFAREIKLETDYYPNWLKK